MAIIYFAKGSNERISENFRAREFDCPCGRCKSTPIDVDFVIDVLQPIRTKAGKAMNVNAYRCKDHNAEVPNASPNSRHMLGDAFDVSINGVAPEWIAKEAEKLGVKGIGCYEKDGFVHLDARPQKSFWREHSQIPETTFLDEDDVKLVRLITELEALISKYK